MTTELLVLAWGTLVSLDLVSFPQLMISRPLIAGTVSGLILGDVTGGVLVGALLELFALDVFPVGAARYPDYGAGAVVGTSMIVSAPSPLGLGIAAAFGLVVAYAGQVGMHQVRVLNTRDVRRNAASIGAGEAAAIAGVHARGLLRDGLRGLVMGGSGLMLAALVKRVRPLDLGPVVLLSVAMTGAAIAAAVRGGIQLTGTGGRQAWFVGGLAVGTVLVVLL